MRPRGEDHIFGNRRAVADDGGNASVGTGDPNPKGFFLISEDPNPKSIVHNAVESSNITDLSVPLSSEVLALTLEERFDGEHPLSALEFTLQCKPTGLASIIIPHDGRKWTDMNGKLLAPGQTAPSIMLKDPHQQMLNSMIRRVSLDVKLKLQQKGDMTVLFNMNVTGEPQDADGNLQDIKKAETPTVLNLKIT